MFAVLLIGRTITRAGDGGEGRMSDVVSTLAIVVLIAELANLGWVAISITRKVFAASLEIANEDCSDDPRGRREKCGRYQITAN